MSPALDGVPVYDARLLEFENPSDLEKLLLKNPLDNKFVEWVRVQGYKIIYKGGDLHKGEGMTYYQERKIVIGTSGKPIQLNMFEVAIDLVNLTIAHELIHVLVPDERTLFQPKTMGETLFAGMIKSEKLRKMISQSPNNDLYMRLKVLIDYEDLIDRIANLYSKNKVFMGAVYKTIPNNKK